MAIRMRGASFKDLGRTFGTKEIVLFLKGSRSKVNEWGATLFLMSNKTQSRHEHVREAPGQKTEAQ